MKARRCLRWADDEGISLVEVMVAMTVLAITMAATAANVTKSLQVARDSRESVLAANIAQYELERVRSIPFVDWVVAAERNGGQSSASGVGPDGQAYVVTRQASWVSASDEAGGCAAAMSGGGSGADYVRIEQRVSFPSRPTVKDVENVTIITPRLGFYDAYTGNLAVIVRNRTGTGVPGHTVHVQSPAASRIATTDASGCAFFAFLPVSPSDAAQNVWTVTIDTPGHVERELKVQRIAEQVTIGAQSTTLAEYEYDRAVTYDPVPWLVRPPATGCTMTRVIYGAARSDVGDASARAVDPEPTPYQPQRQGMECRDGAAALPSGWTATIPQNLAYTVTNPSTTWSALGRVTSYPRLDHSAVPDTSSRPGGEICSLLDGSGNCTSRLLFPYSEGYGIYAGRCPMSDPQRTGAAQPLQLDATPGTDVTNIQVPLGLATINARDGSNSAGVVDVYADMRDPSECPGGDRIYLGRTASDGTLRALMPFGRWVVFWSDVDRTPLRARSNRTTPYTCADVASSSCLEVRADGAGRVNDITGYAFNAVRGDRV